MKLNSDISKVNYSIIGVEVANDKVSFFALINFMWKILFFEKAIVILNIFSLAISVIFSIIFQLFYNDQEQVIVMFNFYFIFLASILLFILILRLCMILWNNKVDDKTVMNLVTSNNSRTRIIMAFFVCGVLNATCTIMINAIIILIPEVILHQTFTSVVAYNVGVMSLYMIFISTLLIWFFTTAMLFINKSVALMLSVLIMTLQLISAVPQKFHEIKEESIFLPFRDGTTMSVSRIRNVIDLQANIGNANIRFPNLSGFINQNFLNANLRRGNNFYSSTALATRKGFWEMLGVISNASAERIQLTGQFASRMPNTWLSGSSQWSTSHELEFNIWFKDDFISMNHLEAMLSDSSTTENYEVIRELYEFSQYIQSYFSTSSDFQRNYLDWFDNFFSVTNSCTATSGFCSTNTDESYSYVENIAQRGEDVVDEDGNVNEIGNRSIRTLTTEDLITIYQNYFFDVYSGITLRPGTDSNPNTQLTNLIGDSLFNPVRLAARILENYFIESTSDFLLITDAENPMITSSSVYAEWRRSAFFDSLFYLLNPVCWVQSVYTYFAREASDEIWFNWQNRSNISFTEQNNLFLTYLRYNIALDESDVIKSDTYNNVYPIWVFMLILVIIILLIAGISIYRFNKMDLN